LEIVDTLENFDLELNLPHGVYEIRDAVSIFVIVQNARARVIKVVDDVH
jgi:hypothetical protein